MGIGGTAYHRMFRLIAMVLARRSFAFAGLNRKTGNSFASYRFGVPLTDG
jgi:hypothetical protein